MPSVRTSSVAAGAKNPSLSYIVLNEISFIAIVGLIWCASVCGYWKLMDCPGETASRRIREARARQIVRAGKPQAQDARATKQARPETKSKKTVESKYS